MENKEPEPVDNDDNDDYLKITPLATDKSKIKVRPTMEAGIVPKHPVSVMFCGKSGMGKTQLLLNLLTKKQFYKDYFDVTFLFSETAKSGADDLYQKHAGIPDEYMFKPDKEGLEQLDRILKVQKKIIKDKGIAASPKILIIFDDIAHSRKFLASNQYLLLHIANRHFNISTFSLTQSYVKIPRSCRCQVGGIMFFHGATNTEKLRLSEEHTPANHTEKEFLQIIDHATADKYNFLFVNKQADMKQRYRKNLDEILELNK
jgi:hypothetical protein